MAATRKTGPSKGSGARKRANGSLESNGSAATSRKPATTKKREAASTSRAAPTDNTWNLRLYVAGDTPKSRAAVENLRRLCDAHIGGKYTIEVVDLKTRPELAKADQILALPTLIRKIPEPMKRVIGDLSNAERALLALDLASAGR